VDFVMTSGILASLKILIWFEHWTTRIWATIHICYWRLLAEKKSGNPSHRWTTDRSFRCECSFETDHTAKASDSSVS